jgi:hypothetical protein
MDILPYRQPWPTALEPFIVHGNSYLSWLLLPIIILMGVAWTASRTQRGQTVLPTLTVTGSDVQFRCLSVLNRGAELVRTRACKPDL